MSSTLYHPAPEDSRCEAAVASRKHPVGKRSKNARTLVEYLEIYSAKVRTSADLSSSGSSEMRVSHTRSTDVCCLAAGSARVGKDGSARSAFSWREKAFFYSDHEPRRSFFKVSAGTALELLPFFPKPF